MSDANNSDSEVLLDFQRQQRTGLSEAIFCEGKSNDQLLTIAQRVVDEDKSILFSRLSEAQFSMISAQHPEVFDYDNVSRTALHQPPVIQGQTQTAVVTGGSSDVSVAREATRTLNFYGHPVLEINDVGVAGLWRVTERLPELTKMKILICVAGMDAALPTVLGGLVGSAIIAVPTSVGYGMAKDGETALRSLLVSCSSGLTVVNIDNGFGAACAAVRILNNFNQ